MPLRYREQVFEAFLIQPLFVNGRPGDDGEDRTLVTFLHQLLPTLAVSGAPIGQAAGFAMGERG